MEREIVCSPLPPETRYKYTQWFFLLTADARIRTWGRNFPLFLATGGGWGDLQEKEGSPGHVVSAAQELTSSHWCLCGALVFEQNGFYHRVFNQRTERSPGFADVLMSLVVWYQQYGLDLPLLPSKSSFLGRCLAVCVCGGGGVWSCSRRS